MGVSDEENFDEIGVDYVYVDAHSCESSLIIVTVVLVLLLCCAVRRYSNELRIVEGC